MLLPGIYFLIALTTIAVSVRFGGRRLSPAVIYVTVWSLVIFVTTRPGRGYLPLGSLAWRLLFIALGGFLIACLVVTALGRSQEDATREKATLYDAERLRIAYRWALVGLLASVSLEMSRILPLVSQAGGLSGILGGQGLSFREAQNAAAAAASTTSLQGGSFVLAVLGYVVFVGYITLIWGGYYAAIGQWGKAVIPLLLLAVFSLVTLQRFAFVYSLIIFLFSLRYHRRLLGVGRRGSLRPLAVMAVLLVAVVFIPLQLRGQAVNGSQRYDSVVDYFAGGLAGLNTTFVEGVPAPGLVPGYGTYTFWGAASIVARVGVPIDLPPNLLPYSSISQTRVVTGNVGTYMIYPYYDFGVVGVAVGALLLGALATWLEGAVLIARRVQLMPAACIVLTTVVMSFFGLSLVRDARWLFLLVAAVYLTRYVRVSPDQLAPDTGPASSARSSIPIPARCMDSES